MNHLQVSDIAARRRTDPASARKPSSQTGAVVGAVSSTEWMDRERDFPRMLNPDASRMQLDPNRVVMNRRRANLRQQLAALRGRGRMPRVCLYALTAHAQETPASSLEEARAFAVREGWQVGTNQVFADHTGPTRPETRPGWARVQRQVQSGFADGVVTLTRAAVTPHHEEYVVQLQWFADRFGFIALVHPEDAVVQL